MKKTVIKIGLLVFSFLLLNMAYTQADITITFNGSNNFDEYNGVEKIYFASGSIYLNQGNGSVTPIEISNIRKITLENGFSSIESITSNETVFPNPTSEVLYFSGFDTENISIQIFSLTGQLVKNCQISGDEILDVSDLPSGTYIAKINNKPLKFSKI